MITLSIDVTQLDKARFREVKRRDGKIAKYCDLVLIPTPSSDYGDFIVKQGVSKEEREQRVEMPILGNAKHLQKGGSRSAPKPAPSAKPDNEPEDDEVPF